MERYIRHEYSNRILNETPCQRWGEEMRYAQQTLVSVEKSKAEIEALLLKYGASKFASGWDLVGATIAFQLSGRYIRFILPLPDKGSKQFMYTPELRRMRSSEEALKAWEQACRQKWRALALVIKAKLEAVESGITSFEDEFMANIVMPGGKTVSEMVRPEIAAAYQSGKPLQLMAGY